MDVHEHDAVSDRALERELQALLRVEASPAFVARVRTRVAQEPQPRAWWLPWLAGGTAAASVVVALAVMHAPGPRAPVWQQTAVEHGPRTPDAVGPGVGTQADRQESALQTPAVQHRRRRPDPVARRVGGSVASEPEILVDPREAAALRALAQRVREGRADLTAIVRAAPIAEQPPLVDLTIEPIVVEPLRADGGERGVQP